MADQQALPHVAELGDLAILRNPAPTVQSEPFYCGDVASRVVLIDVPLAVDYLLYPEF